MVMQCGRAKRPQHKAIGGKDHDDTGDDRALAHPCGVILQLVQPPAPGHEAIKHPVGETEDPHFLSCWGIDSQSVDVVSVALRLAYLFGVAILPDRALPEQP